MICRLGEHRASETMMPWKPVQSTASFWQASTAMKPGTPLQAQSIRDTLPDGTYLLGTARLKWSVPLLLAARRTSHQRARRYRIRRPRFPRHPRDPQELLRASQAVLPPSCFHLLPFSGLCRCTPRATPWCAVSSVRGGVLDLRVSHSHPCSIFPTLGCFPYPGPLDRVTLMGSRWLG
jgi:hypothetical protein